MNYDSYLDSKVEEQAQDNADYYNYLQDFLYCKYDDLYEYIATEHDNYLEPLQMGGIKELLELMKYDKVDELITKFCRDHDYGEFIYEQKN